jgi:hypothetical protein
VHLQNFLAWVVAGALAYQFYIVPNKERAAEQKVRGESDCCDGLSLQPELQQPN